ncbi:MAG: SDR family oxidoreductase [Nanoarchaeota archaeon]|nr:SDR family oxidoreductase [Nanoarchaeota archaeon]
MGLKTVLLTGCSGFIGSNLTDFLLKKGYRVIGMDNLCSGRQKNIEHLKNNPNFLFINADITKKISVDEKLDFILHFASRASPPDYQEFPIETLMANSFGTLNLLELAKKNEAVLVFASTSETYGDAKVLPTPETYWGFVNPIGPRSCYDESKRFGEALCMAYHRQHKVEVRIIRIFNTYGPRMKPGDGRVVTNFIIQSLNNQPLTIFGDGEQTRSFCYVDDLIDGVHKVMTVPNISGEVFNLGNPAEKTMKELAEKIQELVGKTGMIYKELPVDDPQRRLPDISKAKSVLDWDPKTSLDDGLQKTIEYLKQYIKK